MKDEYSEDELRREEWEKAEKLGMQKGVALGVVGRARRIQRL